ncbi:NAD(P)-binding protein [Podospora aff. communis PSN243]|uniref:NAD(P)-binding protein n=1 Tax=Podospora aff. communis PSN243 TaxID=3040156 RepID=A0AAV9GUV9_9PEZI|nr:NAD(P)-binding protein [Podospora aff. communis PSN243]
MAGCKALRSAVAKTIVATGLSSGLGFELARQFLVQPSQPYKLILGARDVPRTQAATALKVLPLELSDFRSTKTFAHLTLEELGGGGVDYLLLNAAVSDGSETPGSHGSKWSKAFVVNHLAQHYLVHLLREKLVESKSRLVFVSSGAVRQVEDPSVLEGDVKDGSGVPGFKLYSETKFVELLGAHRWRRELAGECVIVAVSPGLIPGTGLGRGMGMDLPKNMPDAKSVPEGAASILAALTRDDLPEDPEQIFLTSWGEWWPKDVYGKTLDRELQEKWCPCRDEIEKEEGLVS